MEIRSCPKCGGRSFTPQGDLCWHCEGRAREPRRASANERILLDTIPQRFQWAMFTAPELPTRISGGKDNVDLATKAIVTRAHIVVLTGKAGTGKTSLGCAMIRAWQTATRQRVRFVAANELANARMQHALGVGEVDLVDQCGKADLLLIDDLGSEPVSPPRAEISDVIQRRHNYNLPTWFTTGLKSPEITTRYGGGISRRIQEEATLLRLDRS